MLHLREHVARDPSRHPLVAVRLLRSLPTFGDNLFDRIGAWISPWNIRAYPGRMRILTSVVGFRVTYDAMKKWRRANRRIPPWAARMFADHIEAQCEIGLALVRELRQHAADTDAIPHNLSNLAKLRADGTTKRGMGARARQLPVVTKTEE